MKHKIIAGAVLLAAIAGWASAQTVARPTQPPVASIDQTSVLAARVQQLQNRVQTLEARMQTMETANETQGSSILQLMAFRSTTNTAIANASQAQTASQQQHAALQQRFDTHTHNYNYPNIVWNNRTFVTAAHATGDDTAQGSYISVWVPIEQTTGAPK